MPYFASQERDGQKGEQTVVIIWQICPDYQGVNRNTHFTDPSTVGPARKRASARVSMRVEALLTRTDRVPTIHPEITLRTRAP